MIGVLILSVGLLAAFFGMPGVFGSIALGIAAGFANSLASSRWPKLRPTYIDPVNRPRPISRNGQVVVAAFMAVGAVLLGLVALKMTAPSAAWQSGLFYFSGAFAGLAVGMLVTADRERERHNEWLAKMSPKMDA